MNEIIMCKVMYLEIGMWLLWAVMWYFIGKCNEKFKEKAK